MADQTDFGQMVNRAIRDAKERVASQMGVSVPEMMARAEVEWSKLQRRRGLVCLSGGRDAKEDQGDG